MYTGVKLFRIFPGYENQITRRVPSRHGPGPDQPVRAIKLYYLIDDNIKVTTRLIKFVVIGIIGEPSRIKVHSNELIGVSYRYR